MTQDHQRIEQLLTQLEEEMRGLSIWGDQPPDPTAFASTLPFYHDRMGFHEWLQWVFVPRIARLAEQRIDFPGKCDIAPMSEVWFEQKQMVQAVNLVRILQELDRQLSA
ncbi:MAG: hypothetical protein C0631_06620 [Sedimenticola sp.]|jgi:uncharacterized protein YqcC (DUF446 family)|nr:MAG: hypothetical protein C0631_06620 [Sedimenticola sp.]